MHFINVNLVKDRAPSSARQLKRYFLEKGISANVVKWLGYYDIAVPEHPGKLIPTGIRALYQLSFAEWEELVIKAKKTNPF